MIGSVLFFFFFAAAFILADDVGLGLVDCCGSIRVATSIAPSIVVCDRDWLGCGSGVTVARYFWNSNSTTTITTTTSRVSSPGIAVAAGSVALRRIVSTTKQPADSRAGLRFYY